MDVAATQTGQTATAATSPAAAPAPDNAASIGSDFETFLALLTAQMRNQDPLKPVESTEFVSQLASFSAVEQQVRSNDTLDSILAALSGDSLSGLSQWIGREIRIAAAVAFDGAPVTVTTEPVEGATNATLLVTDGYDTTVATIPVSTTQTELTWDGLDKDGNPAAPGDYRFSVVYADGDGGSKTVAGQVFVPVTEVRLDNGQANLVVADGTIVPIDGVPAVRAVGDVTTPAG